MTPSLVMTFIERPCSARALQYTDALGEPWQRSYGCHEGRSDGSHGHQCGVGTWWTKYLLVAGRPQGGLFMPLHRPCTTPRAHMALHAHVYDRPPGFIIVGAPLMRAIMG